MFLTKFRNLYKFSSVIDPYQVLVVDKVNPFPKIKKAYYKMAAQYHPDINKHDLLKNNLFQQKNVCKNYQEYDEKFWRIKQIKKITKNSTIRVKIYKVSIYILSQLCWLTYSLYVVQHSHYYSQAIRLLNANQEKNQFLILQFTQSTNYQGRFDEKQLLQYVRHQYRKYIRIQIVLT